MDMEADSPALPGKRSCRVTRRTTRDPLQVIMSAIVYGIFEVPACCLLPCRTDKRPYQHCITAHDIIWLLERADLARTCCLQSEVDLSTQLAADILISDLAGGPPAGGFSPDQAHHPITELSTGTRCILMPSHRTCHRHRYRAKLDLVLHPYECRAQKGDQNKTPCSLRPAACTSQASTQEPAAGCWRPGCLAGRHAPLAVR